MARPASGQVLVRSTHQDRTFALRFRAYGKRHYLTLGTSEEGWSRQRAEHELANILADVRRGIWQPPRHAPAIRAPLEEPTFHEYASEWFAQREQEGLKPKTITDLRWSLVKHLLPFFAEHRVSEITPREIRRYTQTKLAERNAIEEARAKATKNSKPFRERSLSNGSINHTLRHLAQVLEVAVDDELLSSNPASGNRRRLKAAKPARPWVEPEQLMAFLESAPNELGRLLVALLAGTGLRIGEALALTRRNVDLGTSTLRITDSKTAKGIREVHLSTALPEQLDLIRGKQKPEPDEFVIATSTGHAHNASNLRRDVLAPTATPACAARAATTSATPPISSATKICSSP